jgi:hypothetical protein
MLVHEDRCLFFILQPTPSKKDAVEAKHCRLDMTEDPTGGRDFSGGGRRRDGEGELEAEVNASRVSKLAVKERSNR